MTRHAVAGHVERDAPKAQVVDPAEIKHKRRTWHKSASSPCVLKPGTAAWARLWPKLTEPDPGDRDVPEEALLRRPRTRADCMNGPRPCPFVSCPHHRYLSVNPRNGSIVLHCPSVLPWEMEDSCLLDVIDRGGEMTLASIGKLHNVTKERIRQVVASGEANLKARCLQHGLTPDRLNDEVDHG
jgi:hypothetical protein